jgi:manganese/zinc/iron transport system substrate-binding protein
MFKRTVQFLSIVTVLVAWTAGSVSAGGTKEPARPDDGILRIVGTTTQAYDLLDILTDGAEGVEIDGLMGAGVDPHLYQPTERDVRTMNMADMVVYSGLHLEGQFSYRKSYPGQQGASAVSDAVAVSYRKSYPGQQGASAVSDAVAVEE